LPFIISRLGMKIIHLLPINPVPTSYGRMGMYGSPYATNVYFGIEHTYATFRHYKTIEDQFIDVTSTIHGLGARVLLDMVINHTGWASSLLFTHRHWFKTAEDHKLISPGAWGVVWGDLVELDYKHRDLWQDMAGVFLAWCQRGIDGFRLDAGYMIPLEVWQYIISRVRQQFPDTVFLLEGLGGPLEVTEKLLTEGQINWAYSELFQNYSRHQITDYLHYAQKVSAGKGVMVNYAETHDNDRLAKSGKVYTLMRLQLCAFTSFTGAWGLTNGVEWLATEKINVHRKTALNWGSDDNLVDDIALINKILADNPAFWHGDNLSIVTTSNDNILAFVRANPDRTNVIVCLINLDTEHIQNLRCDLAQCGIDLFSKPDIVLCDLLQDDKLSDMPDDRVLTLDLEPGQCQLFCLDSTAQPIVPTVPALYDCDPDRIAIIYQILLSRFEPHEVGRIDQEKLLRQVTDFRRFIALVNTVTLDFLRRGDITDALQNIDDNLMDRYSAVWSFREGNKEFIISGDKWLVAHTFLPCTAYLRAVDGNVASVDSPQALPLPTGRNTISMESIHLPNGLGHLTFFPPQPENQHYILKFYWKIERDRMIQRQWQDEDYPVLSVPSGRKPPRIRKIYPIKLSKQNLTSFFPTVLLTNGAGTIAQIPAQPGQLNTKYDTFLALAPDPQNPAHRISLVKTLRETVQVGQKFFDLDDSFLTNFTRYPHPVWEFHYDDGEYFIRIRRVVIMPRGENSIYVRYRVTETNSPIKLTVKCFLEHRDIHDQVKTDRDDDLRQRMFDACKILEDVPALRFTPAPDLSLNIIAKSGRFINQPQWMSDIPYPLDALNGLDDKGDLFAPGVFQFELSKASNVTVLLSTQPGSGPVISAHKAETAHNQRVKELVQSIPAAPARKDFLMKMLVVALDQFLVKPADTWMFMAGFPWLGMRLRDALHSAGGLLAAGRDQAVRDIIISSAATEENGLLLDWLGGQNQSRTSLEASLRLFTAVAHYLQATGRDDFLDTPVDAHRSLRQVLVGIFENFTKESPDQPHLDSSSGLLYCPPGYTWMNTEYPRATPRQGYPVELQALWYRILPIIAKLHPPCAPRASQIQQSIEESFISLYWDQTRGYLADVLLAVRNEDTAVKSLVDSALRFNQLAAVNSELVSPQQARQIVDIINQRLLIPAGIRSLAEEPLAIPLKIVDDHGDTLVDPRMPYQGKCVGHERDRRLAYHNGTAWPCVFPSFIEARAAAYDYSDLAVKQALAFFEPLWNHLTVNGIGTITEMQDGNYPHHPRGCFAHALSVAETLRVYMRLKYQCRSFSPHPQPPIEQPIS